LIEVLVGSEPPTKVWENDFIEFFAHVGTDGSVWFHHNLKVINRSVIKNTPAAIEEFFVTLNTALGIEDMYSYCTNEKILKWALFNGCEVVEDAVVNGEPVVVVRYK
jgi:hypothetical protein